MNSKRLSNTFLLFILLISCGLLLSINLGKVEKVRADHAFDAQELSETDSLMLNVTEGMIKTAQALLATVADGPGAIENAVGYDRRALLSLDFNDPARTNYVYWPYLRKGLTFDYMSAQQKSLTHDLLNQALSAKGYLSAIQVMQMEEVLASIEVIGFPRGTENYSLAIFGEPAADKQWGWRFEGHHLSLNFTVSPGEVSVTPSFFGASPAKLLNGNLAGFRNQRAVHEFGYDFIHSLTQAQQAIAIQTGNIPFDIISGNLNKPPETWNDWKSLPKQGIEIASLSPQQKSIIQSIVDEVISTYRPEISAGYLSQVDVNELRFVWFGSTEAEKPHYYRLEGSDFFFEYDLAQGNGNHVHAVWRSKDGDFGEDLLVQHRRDAH